MMIILMKITTTVMRMKMRMNSSKFRIMFMKKKVTITHYPTECRAQGQLAVVTLMP